MQAVKEWMGKYRKITIAFLVALSIIISLMGGLKLVVYLFIFFTGLFLGAKYKGVRQLYEDYKLGLRLNTLLYHSRKSQEMKKENEDLKAQLKTAAERMELYKAAQVRKGVPNVDDFHRNGFAGVREDSEAL